MKSLSHSIIFCLLLAGLSSLVTAQTATMNYVQSFDVQILGITDPDSLILSTPTSTALQTIQYFDGLGRPVQTVQKGINSRGYDLIKPVKHNEIGLDAINYEPYVDSIQPSAEYRNGFEAEQPAFYFKLFGDADGNGWSPTDYEKSPLNRVLKQGAPGNDWQLNNHTVSFGYLANTDSDPKLNATLWKVSGNTCSFNDNYSNNELYVTKTTNEDGAETYEFKDKQGQVVLKRSVIGINNDTLVSTYYVYDDFGLLRFVISPEGSAQITRSFDASDPLAKKYVYCYTYDARKRLIEKQIPGKEPEYYVYDKTDKVILYQDGNMRTEGNSTTHDWMFTKYDGLGRVIITGIISISKDDIRETLQNESNSASFKCSEFISYDGRGREPKNKYYSDQSYPALSGKPCTILTLNYYDTYNIYLNGSHTTFAFLSNPTLAPTIPSTPDYQPELKYVAGKPTVSFTAYNSDTAMLASASYYDIYGRTIQTVGENHLSGFDRVTSLYKGLTGNVQNSVHLHNAYKKINLPDYTYTRSEEYNYTYDHAGRQTGYDYTYNDGIHQTVSNTYNTLGQLASKQIAEGGTILQTIDYQYNIRGWLTKINDPSNLAATGDLFGMELVYNTKNTDINNTPAYNGNISGAIWQSAQPTGITTPNVTGQKAYIYSYDKLNRLLTGDYLEIESNAWNNSTKKYSENIINSISGKSYDLNGNIQGIVRNGLLSRNLAGVIDRLFYTYDGNKLIAVDNGVRPNIGGNFLDNGHYYSVSHTAEYAYDANGNLTRDDNKEIINITYNYLNLPVSIDKTGGKRIVYIYDATGNKLRQDYYENGTITKTTDFVGNFVYENKIPAWVINNEGRVILNSIGTAYCKEVYLKDHLGNVRIACRLESGVLRTRQVNSYYPFGMNIKELSPNSSAGIRPNEYLYNGKMMQDEMSLGWLDYGARFYDAVLGRFHVPDPLIEWHFNTTPYHYCFNNPINLFDEFGLDTTNANSGNKVEPKTPDQHPAVMLPLFTVVGKDGRSLFKKILDKISHFLGNINLQNGGIPLTTDRDVGFQNKTVVPHADSPVNSDLMILAVAKLTAGPRPTGWDPITTPIGLSSRVSNVTKSALTLTSDKKIVKKTGGNNNEVLISTVYRTAWLDNTTWFDMDGDSVVRNEGDTTAIEKTYLNKATGEKRTTSQLYKKGK